MVLSRRSIPELASHMRSGEQPSSLAAQLVKFNDDCRKSGAKPNLKGSSNFAPSSAVQFPDLRMSSRGGGGERPGSTARGSTPVRSASRQGRVDRKDKASRKAFEDRVESRLLEIQDELHHITQSFHEQRVVNSRMDSALFVIKHEQQNIGDHVESLRVSRSSRTWSGRPSCLNTSSRRAVSSPPLRPPPPCPCSATFRWSTAP